jgi:hypothetical protein
MRRGDERCVTTWLGKEVMEESFINHVVERKGDERSFNDHIVRKGGAEQNFGDQVI